MSTAKQKAQLERLHKSRIKPETPFNFAWAQYRSGAKKRGLKFLLTRTVFNSLILCNCYWCGREPDKVHTSEGGYTLWYSGIDRMDSSGDYTEENCVPCCARCNIAKNNMSKAEFQAWIARVFNYQQLGKL